MLCTWGMWNAPPDLTLVDLPEGHLCYDVITRPGDGILLVRHLPETRYAQTDPNVLRYGLQTCLGIPVHLGEDRVGSLCAVF